MSKKGNKKGSEYTSKWLEILDSVTNIIIVPILVLSIICSIVMINAKRNNSVPNIFGYSLVTILSDSMTNSGFEVDDTVLVKDIDAENIKIGDIIAYYKYIETNKNIAEAARLAKASEEKKTEAEVTEAAYLNGDYPMYSKVSSWRLYLNKIFSNLSFTATEASERAIRANSTIIFHQVVEIVEYQNATWFKTWGTSNVNPLSGDPEYDGYWIKEDYVIGVYTETSAIVRDFLGFASTNTGIIWMVEIPSGIQFILSTLELIEIIDMMTRLKHDQIKKGTYVDKAAYKKMLKERRKLLATGNIDVDSFRRFGAPYENYTVGYNDKNRAKSDININGPPKSSDTSDAYNMSFSTGGRGSLGPPNKNGPPYNTKDGPPYNTKDGPPLSNRDGPPFNNRDGTIEPRSQIEKSLLAGRPKTVLNEPESDIEIKSLEKLKSVLMARAVKNSKRPDIKLGLNEIMLTPKEVASLEDMYSWTDYCFVSKARISKKGLIVEPNRRNEIFLVDNKLKKQYSMTALGTIYSVHCGLIVSGSGLYKVIIRPEGVIYEKINIDPTYKVYTAKQDIFGNICIGVTNGPQDEQVSFTSDGKRISLWSRNALLALGDDRRLYFITMDNSFDLAKGKITDLKVISRDGSLVAVKPKLSPRLIFFEDGYNKYGFVWYNGNYLCLDNGYMFFNLVTKQTITLPKTAWQLSDEELAFVMDDGNLYKISVFDYLEAKARGSDVNSIKNKLLLFANVDDIYIKGNNLECTATNSNKRFVIPLSEKFLARAHIRNGAT